VRLHGTDVLDKLLQMNLTEDVFEQILGILEREQHSQMRRHRGIRKAGVPQGDPHD
jgi:hypothetical protein